MNPNLCLLPKLLLSGLVHPTHFLSLKTKQTNKPSQTETSNCRHSQACLPFSRPSWPHHEQSAQSCPGQCRTSCICHLTQTLPLVIKVEKLPEEKDPFTPECHFEAPEFPGDICLTGIMGSCLQQRGSHQTPKSRVSGQSDMLGLLAWFPGLENHGYFS